MFTPLITHDLDGTALAAPVNTARCNGATYKTRTIDDLRIGMELPGIVSNITNFGAFVDIGIKENGLIHLSQLAQKYVSNPNEIVSIHQQVRVKVLSVDTERKRIQLTMIGVSG